MICRSGSRTKITQKAPIMRERDNARISALRDWLDGLLSAFGDRIHPADAAIAVRAGRLLPFCNQGHVCHRFHDAVLVATAQACGHGLLSKRVTVFGAWTKVALPSP
jgi:hypothetical protein